MEYSRQEIRRQRHLERKRRQNRLIVIVVLVIVGIIAGFLAFIFAVSGGSRRVPKVTGLTYAQAGKKVKEAKLVIKIDSQQDTSMIKNLDKLKVVKQDPGAGSSTYEGFAVVVQLEGVPLTRASGSSTKAQATAPSQPVQASSPAPAPSASLVSPIQGNPIYPFTKDASISCGHWPSGSQDYPYFGAPRDGNSRTHAAIDIYPAAGVGAPIMAIKDGTVLKIAPFYTRASGEVTYGVLVDHGDFVANYAELQPPAVKVGSVVKQGEVIGTVSGTEQLHFEQYAAGTKDWTRGWYGTRPSNLLDPTEMILKLI